MFIITVKYLVDLDVVDQYLIEHRQFLDTLYAQNLLIASGPQNPRVNGGVIISLHKDRRDVDNMIEADPFYIHKVASYSIMEFNPVKHHTTIADLIQN